MPWITQEWESFKTWLTAPFTSKLPFSAIVIMVAFFFIVMWIVYDNLDIVTRGFKTIEEATKEAA